MWDKIEIYARMCRYPAIILAIGVFIASNLHTLSEDPVLMYLFFTLGIIWMLSTAYIEVRETARTNQRVRTGNVATTLDIRPSPSHGRGMKGALISPYKWLMKYSAVVGILVVAGGAIALYAIPSRPWWGVVLVILGPVAMIWMRQVERRGRDNESLIRQLRSLVEDAKTLEYSIRNCARDFLGKPQVQNELGGLGAQGWRSYFERMGSEQIDALSLLKRELERIHPFENSEVDNALVTFYQILGRVLEAESRFSLDLCQKLSDVAQDTLNAWEYVRQTHQRMATQLSGLNPLMSERGRGDLFKGFVNQLPQGLRITA